MPDHYPDRENQDYPPEQLKGYALSGKIMLSAIIILFFVVILMVCLHLYARWYLLRARHRHHRRNRHNRPNRRTHILFQEDLSAASVSVPSCGLADSVIKSLPVFVYSFKTEHQPPLECAVCLSEFEDSEKGRLLPKCKHSFHIECIDMWFHSHSTCPLCRAPVEQGPDSENPGDVVLNVGELERTESGPSSGLCSECCAEDGAGRSCRSFSLVGTSSFGARRKPSEIVVPRRNESFGRSEGESSRDSPSSQAYKSPMSRMLSFKRILSREKRNGGVSPSGNAGSCSSVAESDVERGREGAE